MGVCERVTHGSKERENFLSSFLKTSKKSFFLKKSPYAAEILSFLPVALLPSSWATQMGTDATASILCPWIAAGIGVGTQKAVAVSHHPGASLVPAARGRLSPRPCLRGHGRVCGPAGSLSHHRRWPSHSFRVGVPVLPHCLQKRLSRSSSHRKPLSRQKGEEQSEKRYRRLGAIPMPRDTAESHGRLRQLCLGSAPSFSCPARPPSLPPAPAAPTCVERISPSSRMLSFRKIERSSTAASWLWQASSARKASRTEKEVLMACLYRAASARSFWIFW